MRLHNIIFHVTFTLVSTVQVNVNAVNGTCFHMQFPVEGRRSSTLLNGNRCNICGQNLVVHYIFLIPYSRWSSLKLIEGVVRSCCRRCPNFKLRRQFTRFLNNFFWKMRYADFIYPIFAYSKSVKVYGYFFVPFYDPPGAFYITVKQKFSIKELIIESCQLWSLLAVCIIMSVVAGFIAWILEASINKEEFPRAFMRGWFEGIWWSFVSMTTVGYGDKTPRTISARLFAVIWILIGIVTFSILTGSLTTIIMEGTTPKTPSMAGSNVGMLQDRIYDANLIAAYGGNMKPGHYCNEQIYSVYDLIDNLKAGRIHGFLLDKYTYWDATVRVRSFRKEAKTGDNDRCKRFNDMEYKGKLIEFFLKETVQTDIPHLGDEVAYGILVKKQEHYDFFRDAIVSNKLAFKSLLSSHYANNTREKEVGFKMRMYELSHNHDVFIVLAVVLGLIICYGIVFEVIRRRRGVTKSNACDSNLL